MANFLRTWLVGVMVLLAAVIALNVVVDPYGILAMPRIAGLTANKLAGAERPLLTKPYLIDLVRPATVVLGSSTVDVGFNPESLAWPGSNRPVFNLGMDGINPAGQYLFLRHALASNHPGLILIGVNFEDSLIYRPQHLSAATMAHYKFDQRLRVRENGTPNSEYNGARLEDLAFATLSVDAVRDSIWTLFHQDDGSLNQQSEYGFNNAGRFNYMSRNDGHYAMVMDKNRMKAKQLLFWRLSPQFDTKSTADMIRLAQSSGAKVIVFIEPRYVDLLEIRRQTDINRHVMAWRSELVDVVEHASMDGEAVKLWDFSLYSRFTNETLPPPRDTTSVMQWNWESVHFRAGLGDLMIQRMLTGDGPEDFGTLVTKATLDQDSLEFDRRQRAWVEQHQGDVRRIAVIVADVTTVMCQANVSDCAKLAPWATTAASP